MTSLLKLEGLSSTTSSPAEYRPWTESTVREHANTPEKIKEHQYWGTASDFNSSINKIYSKKHFTWFIIITTRTFYYQTLDT